MPGVMIRSSFKFGTRVSVEYKPVSLTTTFVWCWCIVQDIGSDYIFCILLGFVTNVTSMAVPSFSSSSDVNDMTFIAKDR
jgi:hypothetical protein